MFDDPAVNAFALPGGKIGVYSGLLQVAVNQDQLATVMGHEVAHVLAKHANARVSTDYATQVGLEQATKILGGGSTPAQQRMLSLLGVGTQVGVVLPFSRIQEQEADVLGQDLMVRAGFDPRASVALWKSRAATGGARPPEFLSTHPASERRIEALQARLATTLPLYEQARAAGTRPHCR